MLILNCKTNGGERKFMAQKLLRDRVEWHPGFYGAVELELRKNRDDLVFDREHPLSSKPIVMDLMVIRKKSLLAQCW